MRDRASQLFKTKADERVRHLLQAIDRNHASEVSAMRADVARLTKERDELARKLESAKAEGRRELALEWLRHEAGK